MKALLLILLFVVQATEPPTYPEGKYCSPKGDIVSGHLTTDHSCSCARYDTADQRDLSAHRMCLAGEATFPSHDPVCKQWCSESHCACPITCDTKGPHHHG